MGDASPHLCGIEALGFGCLPSAETCSQQKRIIKQTRLEQAFENAIFPILTSDSSTHNLHDQTVNNTRLPPSCFSVQAVRLRQPHRRRFVQHLGMQADVCPHRAISGRIRPNLVDSGSKSAEMGPTPVELGQISGHVCPNLDRGKSGSELAKFVLMSLRANFGHFRPNSAQHLPNLT